MFIDTHAHITDGKFDADRDDVLQRAKEAGVDRIIEIGCTPEYWEKSLELANSRPDLYCILGIHPQEAKNATPELMALLETLCRSEKVVAVGEIGFDYHYEYSPRAVQKQVFIDHVQLARRLNKPVCIHSRSAYPDLIATLAHIGGRFSGVVHCYAGNLEEAQWLVDKGFYLGIDGPVTYPNSKVLQEVVAKVPLEKLLLETDCPYLPPQEFRGKRNEPSYLSYIAGEIARIKNVPVETVAEVTTASAKLLFGLK